MAETLPDHRFDEAELQTRLELFRYCDLSQPLMQALFTLQKASQIELSDHE